MNPGNFKLICALITIGVLFLFSGSCKKEEDQFSAEERKNMVMDIDGNFYHIDTIGTQIWMIENLKTTKYRNGDPIEKIIPNNNWALTSNGAWCICNNDPQLQSKYGLLYN